jgi:hypothetical protein
VEASWNVPGSLMKSLGASTYSLAIGTLHRQSSHSNTIVIDQREDQWPKESVGYQLVRIPHSWNAIGFVGQYSLVAVSSEDLHVEVKPAEHGLQKESWVSCFS